MNEMLIHPGLTLEEVLEDRNITIDELSIKTNISIDLLNSIIGGKASIDKNIATKLQNSLSIDASFWLNLQSYYDKDLESLYL